MTAMPGSDLRDDVYYPESDGKPMAETPLHRDEMSELIFRLRQHFATDPSVYVSGNMMMYYEQGNPAACFSPDVFVAMGAGDGERRVYRLWAEACGPTVVFEVSSRSTSLEDEGNKKVLCQRLKVQEYWLYDPEGEYLAPRLQGYRLKAWHYLPIAAEADGSLVSTALGVRLGLAGGLLEVYDNASGARLLRTGETESARVAAEEQAARERTARLAAEGQVAREQTARLAAEQQSKRERTARLAAEQQAISTLAERAAAAETEARRLREELARLRGDGGL
jgi:Uma2 family endonuclease